jgi:hypothetical protein
MKKEYNWLKVSISPDHFAPIKKDIFTLPETGGSENEIPR